MAMSRLPFMGAMPGMMSSPSAGMLPGLPTTTYAAPTTTLAEAPITDDMPPPVVTESALPPMTASQSMSALPPMTYGMGMAGYGAPHNDGFNDAMSGFFPPNPLSMHMMMPPLPAAPMSYTPGVRHVPKVEVQEVEVKVPKIEVQTVEKVVEVKLPKIEVQSVEVPQTQEIVKHVPKVEVVEVVREVVRIEIQTVDKEA